MTNAMKLIATLPAFALAFAAPSLSMAQGVGPAEGLGDDVQTSIVYGDDAAPPCPDDVICVVARLPENDRYRIPESLRFSTDPENTSWASRVESLELVGRNGTLSCSTVGAGGFLGCTKQLIDRAFGEKRTGSAVRFSELIEAARADRLAAIDDEAAAEQERVEQIERAYIERLERERAAPLPDESDAAPFEPAPRSEMESAE